MRYEACWHPQFGEILCLVTEREIGEGEELLSRYSLQTGLDTAGLQHTVKAVSLATGIKRSGNITNPDA